MSDFTLEQERDLLAAEHAMRMLDGEELARAERLMLADRDFREQVEAWQARLAPLALESREEQPDPEIWACIERAIADAAPTGNVVALRRKLGLWRAYGAGATAIAASLALVVGYQWSREATPIASQPPARSAPVLVASLSSEETGTALSVTYQQATGSLLVTPTRLQGATGHDHELWIIPEGGTPVSLGLVRGERPSRHMITSDIAPHFRSRSNIALSVEPEGGSPTGKPTGPVIAAGELIII